MAPRIKLIAKITLTLERNLRRNECNDLARFYIGGSPLDPDIFLVLRIKWMIIHLKTPDLDFCLGALQS